MTCLLHPTTQLQPHATTCISSSALMTLRRVMEESSRDQTYMWIRSPQTRRAHNCRGKVREGMEVGRTHLSHSSTVQRDACMFFSAASPTLFRAGSSLSHADSMLRASGWKLMAFEVYSPAGLACILPSREGT